MKILSSRSHGILDYLFALFLLASPTLFQMEGNLCTITYVLGAAHLAITAMTDFEFGLIKLIPFRIHGLIEVVVALAVIGLAFWLKNNADQPELGWFYYLSIAGVILLVFIITDFKSRRNATVIK